MKGRCLCGAVSITVSDAHEHEIGACHCRMCQLWTGSVFMCFRAEAEAVRVEGEVTRHASSGFAERAFCSVCGSHLWMRDTDRDGAPYDLMPGLFDAARDWPLGSEIYSDRALGSVRLGGTHPRTPRAAFEADNIHVEGDMS